MVSAASPCGGGYGSHHQTQVALMMTSAQVVETSVTITDNSPFQEM